MRQIFPPQVLRIIIFGVVRQFLRVIAAIPDRPAFLAAHQGDIAPGNRFRLAFGPAQLVYHHGNRAYPKQNAVFLTRAVWATHRRKDTFSPH